MIDPIKHYKAPKGRCCHNKSNNESFKEKRLNYNEWQAGAKNDTFTQCEESNQTKLLIGNLGIQ